MDLQAEGAGPARHRLADPAHADDAEPLAAGAGPASRSATSPAKPAVGRIAAPSTSRRGNARISAMVMSAVSSVRTPGVLVTVMPRSCAGVDIDIVDAVAEIGDQLEVAARLRSAGRRRYGR